MNKDNIIKILKTHLKINKEEFILIMIINIFYSALLSLQVYYKTPINNYIAYFFIALHSFFRIPIKKNEKELYIAFGCSRSEINFVIFFYNLLSSLILLITFILFHIKYFLINEVDKLKIFSLSFRNFTFFISITFVISTIFIYTLLSAENNFSWYKKVLFELMGIVAIMFFMNFILTELPVFETMQNIIIALLSYSSCLIISYAFGKNYMQIKDFA